MISYCAILQIKLPRAEARGFLALQTEITSAQPATADIAPGGHSSPGLKAVGFSGHSYKVIEEGLADLVAFGKLFISNPDLPICDGEYGR